MLGDRYVFAITAVINTKYDKAQSVEAGYPVDAFRPIFTSRDTFTHIFDTFEVDLAVRDNDAFIFRVGYQITLLGKIVAVKHILQQ